MTDKLVSAESPAPDIVTRLRAGYPCKEAAADGCCKVMDARSGCICAEAADELARLTAEVERLTKVVEQVSQSSAQRHIIELTRAALNKEPRT